MKVLLVGNPNAGKSTLFNTLTGGHAKVGNWHGVTVGALEKETRLLGRRMSIVDLPGIYSLESMSMEEKLARDYLAAHAGATILFVSECASLERSLPLLEALIGRGHPAALMLTKTRAFRHAGGRIDVKTLENRLRIPVLEAEGRGLKRRTADAILKACRPAQSDFTLTPAFYTPTREGLSRVDRLLLNGFFCVPTFLLLLAGAFFFTFAKGMPGDLGKGAVEWLFTDVLFRLTGGITSPVVRGLVQDGILSGLGTVLGFLPQILLLHFFLILMEESGFLSRLALLTDGFFGKLGLNGRAIFSLLMGFGCTAAAILTTRGLDDRRIQRRVILCLPYISCSAKLPVFLALAASFFSSPFLAVLLLYALGVLLAIGMAFFLRGTPPPFVMELAPLGVPRPLFVLKSLLFQAKQFIIKTATVILAFMLLSWLLSSFTFTFRYCGAEESMLAAVCGGLKYLFAPIGMGDWRIAYAALSGLVAKENVAGALAMFYGDFPYSGASAFAFAVFILTCSPCVSAITASARELGWKRSLLYALLQTASALLFAYVTYFVLCGGIVYALIAATPILALLILGRRPLEKVRRKRKHHAEIVHR